MRLLIALSDQDMARAIAQTLVCEDWDVEWTSDGADAIRRLETEHYSVLLLHQCLSACEGMLVGQTLAQQVCPPRVLFICPPECCAARPEWADAVVCPGTAPSRLCRLIHILSQKPLPKAAAVQNTQVCISVNAFLDEIGLAQRYKGRQYAFWLLQRLIPSPDWERLSLEALYLSCAQQFSTTPAAVERCLRVAVESVFTQGSLAGIERHFGATIDPERGKPTNRAFLLQAAQQLRLALRHSFTDACSPNSSVMHHNPAAPTSV